MEEPRPDLTIVHFNDVYDTSERKVEPVGGAARFSGAVKSFEKEKPLVLFSGDVFNPSIVSTVTKGKHMIGVLNLLGVKASVFGNHDFDFGVYTLEKYASSCNFPWVMSNVNSVSDNKPVAGAKKTLIIDWPAIDPENPEGTKIIRVGVLGIVEEEWLATITGLAEQVHFLDPVEEARRLSKELKTQGVDLVVVLSHMRQPNDEKLAAEVSDIDLILSGHDHFYDVKQVNGITIVKSGTDFRNLTVLSLFLDKERKAKPRIKYQEVEITSKYLPDPLMVKEVEAFTKVVEQKMGKVIGTLGVELNANSSIVRTQECPIGNFITDVIRNEFGCDCVILNSGTIRSDASYGPGPFTLRDLLSILPFPDEIMLIEVTGRQILQALENGVSKYPALEGRFPQVSGIRCVFDPALPAGHRVSCVEIHGALLNLEHRYTLATKTYIATAGADGYTMFPGSKVLIDTENAKLLPTLVRQHFQKLEVLNGMKRVDNLVRNAFLSKKRTWKRAAFMLTAHAEGRIQQYSARALQEKYETLDKTALVNRCVELEAELHRLRASASN